MRATVMHGAGDVRIENVPDAALVEPTDAILRVTRACICDSDLWPYASMEPSETGQSMGHEGLNQSAETAINIARPGGAVGRVGVPRDAMMPGSQTAFYRNVSVGGGPAPTRAYIAELLPDILEGRIEPGKVFDRTVGLGDVPDRYRAMAERESIKVMVQP